MDSHRVHPGQSKRGPEGFLTHAAETELVDERDRLRVVEAAAACVVDTYRGDGGHANGMRAAVNDLADALRSLA